MEGGAGWSKECFILRSGGLGSGGGSGSSGGESGSVEKRERYRGGCCGIWGSIGNMATIRCALL